MENVVTTAPANPLARDLDEVLDAMGTLWDDLRDARIFITGGTGFFGCWLLETLLWANDKRGLNACVTVLTRDADAFARKVPHLAMHPIVTLHAGDIRTFSFPDGAFSHIVHAATTSSAPVEPEEMFETILTGTKRALDFARACGARRFLLTSSGAVYGVQPPEMTHVAEDYVGAPDPTAPFNAYAEGKRAAEMLCAIYVSETLQPTIARCFAFVGPYLPLGAHFAIGNFIADALAARPIRVNGDGTPFRSYLYGAELARWLWTVLLKGASGRAYNVGSSSPLTIGDAAHQVAAAAGSLPVEVAKQPIPSRPSLRYVPSVQRAETELDLRESVSLKESIRRTMTWHRRETGLAA